MSNNRILISKRKVTMSQPPLVIGRGAMGEVYLAKYRGNTVVVKKSQRDIIDNTLLKEYSNYFKLQGHCNILKFFGVIRDDRYSFSLVLEYAPNGNLSSYLKTHTVEWSFKARVCRDIALGLMHCHDNNVLHFDLKPENVLLDESLTPKLADFGISKTKSQMVLDNGKAGGTLNYVAPERVCRDVKMRELFEHHPKLSDVYSFGLILWSVAKDGEHPYESIDDDDIKEQKRSASSIYDLMRQLPENTPPSYSQVIFDLIKYNPCERLDLTIARLELESLFDDDDNDRHESIQYEDSLCIDYLDPDEDDDCDEEVSRANSVSGSEPVSTTTTIESGKRTLASDEEIHPYIERSEETSSTTTTMMTTSTSSSTSSSSSTSTSTTSREAVKNENRLSITANIFKSFIPRRSSTSETTQYKFNGNTSKNRNGMIILDRSLVASPTSNPIEIEIPTIPSLNSDLNNNNNSNNSSGSKHYKHDSGVAGIPGIPGAGVDAKSQTTLVGSPTTPKNPFGENLLNNFKGSRADLALMDEVIAICDNWEKYTDEVMMRKLDMLCHEKGIKPKNLLEIFENNPSKSADYYFTVGFMNEHAIGKAKDPETAFEYYHKASDLGDPRGLVYVGWCFYKGMGTPKDPIKAFSCFKEAAKNGCVSAHNNVGWCYDIGFGTLPDPIKAFECFKSSAEKGYATAQCRVGVCYEYGRGIHRDLEKALEWYTKAANNGHETAKRRVSELSRIIRHGNRRRSFLSSFVNLFHD